MIAFGVELGQKDEWFRAVFGHILQPERREGRALRSFNGVTSHPIEQTWIYILQVWSHRLEVPTLSDISSLKIGGEYSWRTVFLDALSSQLLRIYHHAPSCLGWYHIGPTKKCHCINNVFMINSISYNEIILARKQIWPSVVPVEMKRWRQK